MLAELPVKSGLRSYGGLLLKPETSSSAALNLETSSLAALNLET